MHQSVCIRPRIPRAFAFRVLWTGGVLLNLASPFLRAAPGLETTFTPVARQYGPVPGLSQPLFPGATIYDIEMQLGGTSFALADDGSVVFTTLLTGDAVGLTNNQAILYGQPDGTLLLARTGDPVPGSNTGDVFTGLFGYQPNVSDDGMVAYAAQVGPPGSTPQKGPGLPFVDPFGPDKQTRAFDSFATPFGFLVHIYEDPAGAVRLSGAGIGPTNDMAIVAGPITNLEIVAQEGMPAPGTAGEFADFPGFTDLGALAFTPDGNVAFTASTTSSGGNAGVWFGNAAGIQPVAAPGTAAPDSLLGSGYSFGALGVNALDANARHELAFATTLSGPGLNETNSDVVLAGAPGALRIVAQSGQPAPGITNAVFGGGLPGGVFQNVIIGSDGAVVFAATYDTNSDSGLWLAPAAGGTPILLMRDGGQAPGTPEGVVFTNSSPYAPTVLNTYLNSRGQVIFLATVGGPGVGNTNNLGIWLAEPDGSVSPVVRTGDAVDIGGGETQRWDDLSLGAESPTVAGPEDGRPQPFNDLGAIVFNDNSTGIYLIRTGIVLSAARLENDIRLEFPTLADKHYRVDYKTGLTDTAWSVLVPSVAGNGGRVSVTDTNALAFSAHFYRVVRAD